MGFRFDALIFKQAFFLKTNRLLKTVYRYMGQLFLPVIIYQFFVFILGVVFAAGGAAYDNMGAGTSDNKFSAA